MSSTALALHEITKRFGAVEALDGVSLTVRRGTIHAVLGENGAGKSTLMHIAFGMLAPDAGHVVIDDTLIEPQSSADAIRRGLGMVHQHFTLVPAMTVAENIALGGTGRLDQHRLEAQVAALASTTGLPVDPTARVADLGVGAQQRVEILKALYSNARTIILDEPSAVLTPQESDELFRWLRSFVDQGGTVVLITHKLVEALAVADDVTVLRRGRCVLSGLASTLRLETLVEAITGTGGGVPGTVRARRVADSAACVAQLTDVTIADGRGTLKIRDASVMCRAGEVIGVAGVEGSGVHELLQVLAGRLPPTRGTVTLPPSVGFIPEDRQRDALIAEFSLTENLALRAAGTRSGLMPWPEFSLRTASLISQHDVRAESPSNTAATLSGGNQQKFVIARELADHPLLVVAENPARGLDIRAAAHVFRQLLHCADLGSAVVCSSNDIDEVLDIADRVLVLFAGTLREVPVDRTAVASAMIGAA